MGVLTDIEFDLDTVRSSSFQNCHARGVTSIKLNESQRIFIANPPALSTQPTIEGMEVGFHTHRHDIGIDVIFGILINWVVRIVDGPEEADMLLWRYEFKSAIGNGLRHPEVRDIGSEFVAFEDVYPIRRGSPLHMDRAILHTVTVMTEAAWLVSEYGEPEDITTLLTPEYAEDDSLYVALEGDKAETYLEWLIGMDDSEGVIE